MAIDKVNIGTRKITFNETNTANVMVALISFNSLFDTDVGLVKLIRNYYNDSSVFNQNTLESLVSNKSIVEFVFNSESSNILMDLMINPDKEIADEYYKQFFDKEYADILRGSVYTGVLDLLQRLDRESDFTYSIVCLRQEEINFLKEYINPDISAELPDTIIPKIGLFHQYFFKTFIDDPYFNLFKQYPNGETIYILDYRRNFKEDGDVLPTSDLLTLESRHNRFTLINAYSSDIKRKEFIDNGKVDEQ